MDRADPNVLANRNIAPGLAATAFGHPNASFPLYLPALLGQWVPELEGVDAKLREGALGAAIGHGCVAAAVALAQSYPASHFFGFDPEPAMVRRAQRRAEEHGVSEHTTFEQVAADVIPNHRYALTLLLEGLAESPNPLDVAWRALTTLDPAGSLLIVEPRTTRAGAGRVSSPGSGLAQAGFRRVRLIDETAFEQVFEARR